MARNKRRYFVLVSYVINWNYSPILLLDVPTKSQSADMKNWRVKVIKRQSLRTSPSQRCRSWMAVSTLFVKWINLKWKYIDLLVCLCFFFRFFFSCCLFSHLAVNLLNFQMCIHVSWLDWLILLYYWLFSTTNIRCFLTTCVYIEYSVYIISKHKHVSSGLGGLFWSLTAHYSRSSAWMIITWLSTISSQPPISTGQPI